MTDVYEHNPDDHEDPAPGPTGLVGFLGTVVLVIIVAVLTALYYNVKQDEFREQVVSREPPEVKDLLRQQQQLLTGPARRITVQEAGETVEKYVIPIDRAMELVVEEYGSRSGGAGSQG